MKFPRSIPNPRLSSRYLYAGRHLGSKQVSPKFILEEFAAPNFDVIEQAFDT
jgi:hypothetical protein